MASITHTPMETRQDKSRSYSWCYTLNNYTDEDIIRLEALEAIRHVCAREVGESGTPHLQGYVRFANQQRFSWWKNQFPRMHVQIRRGSEAQAAEYCMKGGDVVIDVGTSEPAQASRKRAREDTVDEVIDMIEHGSRLEDIRARHKRFYFWHGAKIREYHHAEYHVQKGEPLTYINGRD